MSNITANTSKNFADKIEYTGAGASGLALGLLAALVHDASVTNQKTAETVRRGALTILGDGGTPMDVAEWIQAEGSPFRALSGRKVADLTEAERLEKNAAGNIRQILLTWRNGALVSEGEGKDKVYVPRHSIEETGAFLQDNTLNAALTEMNPPAPKGNVIKPGNTGEESEGDTEERFQFPQIPAKRVAAYQGDEENTENVLCMNALQEVVNAHAAAIGNETVKRLQNAIKAAFIG